MTKAAQCFARTLLYLVIALGCSGGYATTAVAADAGDSGQSNLMAYEQNTAQIASKYKNSVVAITVTVQGQRVNPLQGLPPQMRQFMQQFGGGRMQPQQQTERAAGSGFVVNPKGQILTNFHVIAHALKGNTTDISDQATIKVQFSGGKSLPVKVIGVDQSYDLALLQLEKPKQRPQDAQPIPMADSSKIQVGEKAIAIGNPFLLESTVTQGIVSAINREQPAKVSGVPIEYIQTDAAINPGNSGGPLINSQGKVIGVNDEILAPNGTFIGVGFAIPSNLVRDNLAKLEKGGFIKKAMIGVMVEGLSNYPDPVREQLNLPDHGAMIIQVEPKSPAAKAGLKGAQFTINAEGAQWPAGGDIILKANGKKIGDGQDLQKLIFSKSANAKVNLQVLRHDKKKNVTVTLAVLKSQPKPMQQMQGGGGR